MCAYETYVDKFYGEFNYHHQSVVVALDVENKSNRYVLQLKPTLVGLCVRRGAFLCIPLGFVL